MKYYSHTSEGIRAAGIATFAQMVETDLGRLREILTETGIARITDPSTWPEQARLRLAATGRS